jgi:hypothetical protein
VRCEAVEDSHRQRGDACLPGVAGWVVGEAACPVMICPWPWNSGGGTCCAEHADAHRRGRLIARWIAWTGPGTITRLRKGPE